MFQPELAEIRFGYGLSPRVQAAASIEAILSGLSAPDEMQVRLPVLDFETYAQEVTVARREIRGMRRAGRGAEADEASRAFRRMERTRAVGRLKQSLLRAAVTPTPFRERLVAFWGDHFTAFGKGGLVRHATGPYWETAIRPHVAGRFADLLKAAVLHPLMLHYLDQDRSIGPGSKRARHRANGLGLNENLAREVLELHTLGVGGPYTQKDVRQLAELFTGLTVGADGLLAFREGWVEPGKEHVLGKTYGPAPELSAIEQALDDLAHHPATAHHLARKVAKHFISDNPDSALVDHMARSFADSGGDLSSLYAAMLEHPEAWDETLRNAKPPWDFIASSLRAMGVTPDHLGHFSERELTRGLSVPLAMMGQSWQRPNGPDGWPEEDAAWFTPQGLAWRIRWAMQAPKYAFDTLPDPRAFVDAALGPFATTEVRFAAGAAESRLEGLGLVLLAPAFQRR